MNSEERSNDRVALWSCPECAFTFDAAHTDTDGGGYSCPLCAEIDLESRLAAALARIADYEHRISWDTTCGNCARLLDASYNDYCRAEQAEARIAAVEAELARADAILRDYMRIGTVEHFAVLAASPTPTGPEPATKPNCTRPGWCACDPLTPGDEHCQWFGPATPEPTEETPNG